MSVNVHTKIDGWKKKLLDMGKRNKLINFKETKTSTLRFISPNSSEIWEQIVTAEKICTIRSPHLDTNETVRCFLG